jgi:type VI secretion system secreted protein VgrG
MSTTIIPHINLETETLRNGELDVVKLTGREAISQLFQYEILAVCRDPSAIEPEELVGQEAALVYTRDGVTLGRVYGMISVVNDRLETETSYTTFRLAFVPRAYKLTLVETLDVFLDLNVPDVIRQKLKEAGFREKGGSEAPLGGGSASLPLGQAKDSFDFELRLYETYPVRDFVVQYKESDLSFVSRLCEHVGISFFFEHSGGHDVLVFTDVNEGFRHSEIGESVPFRARGEHNDVYSFEETIRMIPAQYVVRDYNYRTPQVTLTGQAQAPIGLGAVVEYGSHVKTPGEAEKMAHVRAQERMAQRRVYEAKSDVPLLGAGSKLAVLGHPRGDTKLLITEVAVSAEQQTLGVAVVEEAFFRAEFKAISESRRYRPPRLTPKPRIHGVVNGVIDSAKDDHRYADVDEHGRYRVRFLFDTTGPGKGQASKLVRMAQPHVGEGFGMHFPLRAGVEVIITFVDGDPDRPIIAAAVPNPQTASTVNVGNSPRNVIRTGAGNEINIDDTQDSARIKLSSPHKNTTFQLGAPNSPERGAMLETEGAWSSVALAGNASFTSVKAEMTAIQKFASAGSIHTVAETPDLIEKVTGVAEIIAGLTETASSIVEVALGAKEFHLSQTKQASVDADAKAMNDRTAADQARTTRDDDETALAAKINAALADPSVSAADKAQLTTTLANLTAYQQADAAYQAELVNLRSLQEMLRDAEVEGEANGRTAYSIEAYEASIEASEEKLYGTPPVLPPGTPTSGLAATRDAAAAASGMGTDAQGNPTCVVPTSGLSAYTLGLLGSSVTDYQSAAVSAAAADQISESSQAAAEAADKAYDTELDDSENGDDSQNLEEAKVRLGQVGNALLLFNDLMQIIALAKKLYHKYKDAKPKAIDFWNTVDESKPRSVVAPGKRVQSPIKKLVKHTLGSEFNTEVYGENELMLRGDKVAKMLSDEEVHVAAGKIVGLHGGEKAEVSAKDELLLTVTGGKLDAVASELVVVADKAASITSTTDDVKLSAIAKAVALSAHTDFTADAKANISLTAAAKAEILAAAWGLKIDGPGKALTLGSDAWQLSIKDGAVALGSAGAAAHLQLAATEATLQASATLNLKGPTIAVVATTFDFGAAAIQAENLVVKGAPVNPAVLALKTEVSAAQDVAKAAAAAAAAANQAASDAADAARTAQGDAINATRIAVEAINEANVAVNMAQDALNA